MKQFALFLCAVCAWGQTTINGNRSILGRLDLSGAVGFIPPTVVSDPSGGCTPMVNGRSQVVLSLTSGNLFSCVSSVWRLTGNPQVQTAGTGLAARGAINVVAPLVGVDNAAQSRTDIFLAQSNASTNGYLSSTDWTTFSGKQNALGYTAENSANRGGANGYAPLDGTSKVPLTNLPPAGTGTSGALSSVDWNTFNGKQAALGYTPENFANKGGVSGYAPLDVTAKVPLANLPVSGTSASGYLSTVDWNAFNAKQAALGFTAENSSKKGAVSGYAPLDASALVPLANLPTIPASQVSGVTGTSPITYSAGSIAIAAATTSANGYLTSADWNTFNAKQAALGFTAENLSNRGGISGYAPLDASRHVPLVNLGTIPASQISGIATSVVTNGLLADYWMTKLRWHIGVGLDDDGLQRQRQQCDAASRREPGVHRAGLELERD